MKCLSLPCQLDEYPECVVKWNPKARNNSISFHMKLNTPAKSTWLSIGFNPNNKKLV